MHPSRRILRASDSKSVVRAAFSGSKAGEELSSPVWAKGSEDTGTHTWTPKPAPSHAEEILEQPEEAYSKEESAMLEQAYQDAFEQGQKEGYIAGLEQGQNEAEESAKALIEAEYEKLRAIGERLEQEIKSLSELRTTVVEQVEEDALHLTMTIASKLAAEAQLSDVDWVAPLIREAVNALTEADRVVCTISSELASRLQEAEVHIAGQGVLLDVRPELGPLDIMIESRFGRVDASFDERVEHLRRTALEQLHAPEPAEQEVA